MTPIRLGIDMMGGDHVPRVPLEGVGLALERLPVEVVLYLFGPEEVGRAAVEQYGPERLVAVPAEEVVLMEDAPTRVFRAKPRSSMSVGFHFLKEGRIDAFASAGNTGAMLVGALFFIGPIEGVMRPAIPVFVPHDDGSLGVLLDVGANADCRPEFLVQFAAMGQAFAHDILHIENPATYLLNVGSEDSKGNQLVRQAYELMSQYPSLNFSGNVEGYSLFSPGHDVVVTDGFTGNVVLKLCEGLAHRARQMGADSEFFYKIDPEFYGGMPILGVEKPVIIGHGSSSANAIAQMIKMSYEVVTSKMVDHIRPTIQRFIFEIK